MKPGDKKTIVQKQKNDKQFNRRNFLGTTAAGSLMLASKSLAQDNTNPSDTVHVALIGTGAQGQNLLNTCMKIPGIHFQAVCDIWESYNLKQASRILTGYKQEHKTYTDYRDMLEKEKNLDAVIIATPDFFHAEQTMACLQAGLNVYCECMMSNTLEGARKMVQAAKDTGKLLQIGLQRRSNPKYRYCFDHIIHETKLLGEITAINGQWNRPVQTDRGWPRRAPVDDATLNKYGFDSMEQFRNWRWDKKFGGGPIVELGAHQIDVFNWFMGIAPKTLLASGGTAYYKSDVYEWYDTVMTIYDYETDERVIRGFYQTINSNSNFGYFENFMGDQGTLYLSEATGRMKVYREPTAPDWEKWVNIGILGSSEEKEEPKKEDSDSIEVEESVAPPSYDIPVKFTDPIYQPHLENFFNSIRGEDTLNCPAEIAFISAVTVLKINETIQNGNKLEFKLEDFQI